MENYRIAIVGAAGLVGEEILRILEQRNFPLASLHLYDTDEMAGKTVYGEQHSYVVKAVEHNSFQETAIAFFAAADETSRRLVPQAVQARATVIDSSAVFRSEPHVPLVVPEVNPDDIQRHRGIIVSPNCSAIMLNIVLAPLNRINPIKRVVLSTYQSVSGLGHQAMGELTLQTQQILSGETPKANFFPHEIGFNILPQVDVFLDNGYTKEEWQLLEQTRKILHNDGILVSATCVRVPTFKGHCQAVTIDFAGEISEDIARDALAQAPGVRVIDDTAINLYPQPRMAAGTDPVMVGRIRQDALNMYGLVLWVVGDNIRKGAALNMVQIAEEIHKKGWLKIKGQK